jgi:hypothetical protein
MALFTFILEYDGGTYLSQVQSQSQNAAVRKWGKHFLKDSTTGLPSILKKALVDNLIIESTIPIAGVSNVWCISASVRKKLALVNLVQTCEE